MAKDTEYLPEEDVREHLAFINRQKTSAPVVKIHHGKWKELISWGDGEQFSEWNSEEQILKPVVLRLRKKRIVVNLMKPLGEAIDGKINFSYRLAGMPNSGETKDINASKASTKLLAHNDYVNNVDALMDDTKFDLTNTGNACVSWVFEKDKWAEILTEGAGGVKIQENQKVGEVICRVPSIFNVRPDPTAKDRDSMRWFIEFKEVERSKIKSAFGVKDEDIDGEEAKTKRDGEADIGDKFVGMNEPESEKDTNEETDIVAYYWEKANDKYTNGRLILSAGQAILYKGPNPALGEIPYWLLRYKRKGNSIWGTGPFHHVQSIQREFNRMISIISEHLEGWRAKMLIPEGSVTRKGAFTMDSFELLEYDPTRGKPEAANMPELSPQIMAWKDFLMGALNQVANVHEVTYSQLPKYASRAPASLFSMMLEQENLKIDPMLKRINSAIKEMGRFRLRLMEKYYKTDRVIKIVGANEATLVEAFSGSAIAGNYDVKIEQGVSMKQSRIVQQRLLLELYQNGLIEDKRKVIRMLDEGDIEETLRGDYVDEVRAKRENQAFINGTWNKEGRKGVFVYLHDVDEVHLDEHTDLSKSEEAANMDETTWMALQDHIMAHMQQAQNKMLIAQQAQAMAQPQGPQAPTGPPGPQTMAEGAQASPETQMERRMTTM